MSEKHKVLIIDDEQLLHTLIKSALEIEEEFSCLHAYNGKEGLALYREHNPAMVILDIKMPVMNGIEFLKALKPSPEALRSIVVCTGYDDPVIIDFCLDLGVRGFLNKPFHINEVMFLAYSCVTETQTKQTKQTKRKSKNGFPPKQYVVQPSAVRSSVLFTDKR